jgi:hypothetical protein
LQDQPGLSAAPIPDPGQAPAPDQQTLRTYFASPSIHTPLPIPHSAQAGVRLAQCIIDYETAGLEPEIAKNKLARVWSLQQEGNDRDVQDEILESRKKIKDCERKVLEIKGNVMEMIEEGRENAAV